MNAQEVLRVLALVKAEVRNAFASIPKPKDGRDGKDGKDAVIPVELIRRETAQALAALPKPKDGRDGKDAVIPIDLIEGKVATAARRHRDELSSALDERVQAAMRGVLAEIAKRPVTQEPISTYALQGLIKTHVDSLPLPVLEIDRITTLPQDQHARAEIRRTAIGYAISFWIPVVRGNQWMGAGFVAQGQNQSGGGTSQQQVFIDSQPTISYPAISFSQISGFPGLYLQSVNVP